VNTAKIRAALRRIIDDANRWPRAKSDPDALAKTHGIDVGRVCGTLADLIDAGALGPEDAALVAASLAWHLGFVRALQCKSPPKNPMVH